MEKDKVTVGETTVEETAPITVIIETIVRMLLFVGKSFKKIGGEFVTEKELKRFISTLYTISAIGPYDTTVTVSGVPYPLDTFKVDTKLVGAFLQPRAIVMPGTSPFRLDVSVHQTFKEIMMPAELIEFQYKFLAMFKVQPTLQSVEEGLKPRVLGDITECCNGKKFHVDDLASVKSVPPLLSVASQLYTEDYFNYDLADVIRMVVTNLYSDLK
jgi:hypothetical protein